MFFLRRLLREGLSWSKWLLMSRFQSIFKVYPADPPANIFEFKLLSIRPQILTIRTLEEDHSFVYDHQSLKYILVLKQEKQKKRVF